MTVVREQVRKGDFVIASESGWAWRLRSDGRQEWNKGEELLVTAVLKNRLNVKRASHRYESAFSVSFDQVSLPPRKVGQPPAGAISVFDPSLAWIFEDAGRMADRLGLCSDYDRLCDALGWPGRLRTWSIKFHGEDSDGDIELTVKVRARSRAEALEKVNGGHEIPTTRISSIKALTA